LDKLFLNEQRCQCGKLLLKGLFFDGALEIKCKKCGTINRIGSIKLADDDTHYMLIRNSKGVITNVSQSACLLLGYTHEELIGKNFSEINPLLSKRLDESFFFTDSLLGDDNYIKFDTTHRTKDGRNVPINVVARLYHPTESDKQILLLAELIDEEKNENVSKKNDLEFMANVCDLYFDIDKNGMIEYVSQSAEKITGYLQDEFVGKKFFDFTTDGDTEEAIKIFKNFSLLGQPYRINSRAFLNKKGHTMSGEMYFAPKYNDMGNFVGYCVLSWLKNNK